MKKHKGKILVLFLAVLLVSVLSCENPFLKKMLVEEEKGNTVPEKPQEPENRNLYGRTCRRLCSKRVESRRRRCYRQHVKHLYPHRNGSSRRKGEL